MTVDDISLKLVVLINSDTDVIATHTATHYTCHETNQIKRSLRVSIDNEKFGKKVRYDADSWTVMWEKICEDLPNIKLFLKDDYESHLVR